MANIDIKTHSYSVVRNTSGGRSKPKYIVMHYTATDRATAYNEIMYFATNPSAIYSSADFFVDDTSIWQYNTAIDSRYSWAVGDGANTNAPYSAKCYNSNQISIEMCCYCQGGKWYITDKTYNNAVALTKYLMNKYGIPASNVIRHYDVSNKRCPQAIGWIPATGEDTWKKFKAAIGATKVETVYRVRKSANDAKTQIGAWKNLGSAKEQADKNATDGYKVFDNNGKMVYEPKKTAVTAKASTFKSYLAVVTADALNVRSGPGTSNAIVNVIHKNEVYTIVEEKSGWGLLKSYQKNRNGWVSLTYVKKK